MHSLFLLDGLPMCTAVFLALACLHFAEPGSCLFCWLLGPELNPVDDSGLTLCCVHFFGLSTYLAALEYELALE